MKLFILGWDNALVADVIFNVHESYMECLKVTDPLLHSVWTLSDTMRMQGLPPEKIWNDLAALSGKKKAEYGRKIFYETYNRLPLPPLADNAELLLKALQAAGHKVVVVSNKTQTILDQEVCALKVDGLIDTAIGTSPDFHAELSAGDPSGCLKSRGWLLKQAIEYWPDAEEVIVIAGAGYAEPAYRLRVDRFEEASAPVFDWVADQVRKEAEKSGEWLHGVREDLLS